MDGVIPLSPKALMPPLSPLAHPKQDLAVPYRDVDAPLWRAGKGTWGWRLAALLPAMLVTGLLINFFGSWMARDGLWWLEYALLSLVTVTFFWIALSVGVSIVGILRLLTKKRAGPSVAHWGVKTALVMPVFNEDTAETFGNAAAILMDLQENQSQHSYDFFILSDTQDPELAAAEAEAYAQLQDWMRTV